MHSLENNSDFNNEAVDVNADKSIEEDCGKNSKTSIFSLLWNYRATLIIILTPIVLLPLPLVIPGTVSILYI